MPEEITVRALTKEDLPAVAQVHLAAFPNSALSKLGREAVRRYYEWQLLGPHQSVALGAFRAATLAGFCFGGYFRGALAGFLKKNQAYLAWRVATHPWLAVSPLFRDRLTTGLRVRQRKSTSTPLRLDTPILPATKPFAILAIAVQPTIQKAGVGRLLMLKAEAAAQQVGAVSLLLTVDTTNTQAIRFYEGLGWAKTPAGENWTGTMIKPLGN